MKEDLKCRTLFSNILILIQVKIRQCISKCIVISISKYKNTTYP